MPNIVCERCKQAFWVDSIGALGDRMKEALDEGTEIEILCDECMRTVMKAELVDCLNYMEDDENDS